MFGDCGGVRGLLRLVARLAVLAALVSGMGVLLPGAAQASFPGGNGRIAYYDYGSGWIWTINPDGSDAKRLTPADSDSFAWSPDGSKLAFSDDEAGTENIYVVDADGGNRVRLTTGAPFDQGPTWSPDGTRIAYTRWNGSTDSGDIYVMDADGANKKQLTSERAYFGDFSPEWSPDGSKIVYTRSGDTEDVWIVDASGRNAKRLFHEVGYFSNHPDWSPDGSKIVFSHWPSGNSWPPCVLYGQLYTMGADGSNPTALTDEPSLCPNGDGAPAWSPDGRTIVFTRIDANNGGGLTLIDADGTNARQVTSSGPWLAAWQPIRFARVAVSVPSPVAAGSAFSVTARSVDGNGQTLTGYNGPATWSDLSGQLSPTAPASFVNGVSTTTATVSTGFRGNRITVTSGSLSGQSGAFDVLQPATIKLGLSGPATVGAAFTVTAIARDPAGRTLAGYNAPASWSDLSGVLSPNAPTAFVNGVSTTTATIAVPFRHDRLTVTASGVGGQTTFNVYGPLAGVTVGLPAVATGAEPLVTETKGAQFLVRAVARDAAGNALVSYSGAASWSSLDGTLRPVAPAAFSSGVSETMATISTAFRSDRITVGTGGVGGQSGPFAVAGPLASIR